MHQTCVYLLLITSLTLGWTPASQAAESLHLLIPGAAGGGWDRTARGVGEALVRANLVDTVTYENMSGGGGSKAMAYLLEANKPHTLMVNSTPIVVRALQKVFPQSYRDFTPVASVIGDYSVLAVRTQSPIETLAHLAREMATNPRAVAIAGGSVSGGTDHIVAAMIMQDFGIRPGQVKYIPYDAGGKAMAGLLSGEVRALSSGYGEVIDLVQQGYVRLLCITAEHRLTLAPLLPTCAEAGAANARFVNWRGFFAAPQMPAAEVEDYRRLLATLQTTRAWQEVRQRYGWVDLYRPGAAFSQLLADQETSLQTLMVELNLL